MFLHLSVILLTGRACVFASGGHAWLLLGGGMCGCSQGACMVAPGGGMRVCSWGACMVALGGMHGCSWWGYAWLLLGGDVRCCSGACMVAPGGACMVAPRGGMHGCSWGGAWLLRYASYWNAFLFDKIFAENCMKMKEIGPRGGHEASLALPPLGSANGKSRKGKLSEFRDEK